MSTPRDYDGLRAEAAQRAYLHQPPPTLQLAQNLSAFLALPEVRPFRLIATTARGEFRIENVRQQGDGVVAASIGGDRKYISVPLTVWARFPEQAIAEGRRQIYQAFPGDSWDVRPADSQGCEPVAAVRHSAGGARSLDAAPGHSEEV